ncbi:MAG: hypothetical protein R3B70_10095 [Polyangiaceae bacterium]
MSILAGLSGGCLIPDEIARSRSSTEGGAGATTGTGAGGGATAATGGGPGGGTGGLNTTTGAGGGDSTGPGGSGGQGNNPACGAPLDTYFEVLWKKTVIKFDRYPPDIAVDADGNTYVGHEDKALTKLDKNGNPVWSYTAGFEGSGSFDAVTLGPNGRVHLSGTNCVDPPSPNPQPICFDIHQLIVQDPGASSPPVGDPDYSALVGAKCAGPVTFQAPDQLVCATYGAITAYGADYSVAWTASPSTGFAGQLRADSANRIDVSLSCPEGDGYVPCLRQHAPDGELLWSASYSNTPVGRLHTGGLEIGPDDRLYASFSHDASWGDPSTTTYWIVQAMSDGSVVWTEELAPPEAPEQDADTEIAVLPSGEVWMAAPFGPEGSFLRGYSMAGAPLTGQLGYLCLPDPVRITKIRSDHSGGLRLLAGKDLYALARKP